MEYIRPSYIEEMPEEFKHYFSSENFKDKPYPGTIEQANDYLLYNVFKVDKADIMEFQKLDENGNQTKEMVRFTKDNYYEIFNHNNWKQIDDPARIIALYWFFEEVCKELGIFKPNFYFLKPLSSIEAGHYEPENHCFCFNLAHDQYEESVEATLVCCAYENLNTIAHELKHAQFFQIQKSDYFRRQNLVTYFPAPYCKDYDFTDEYDRFCYSYDRVMYKFQPTELDSYNYGNKKCKEIFKKANFIKTKNGFKLKKDVSLFDLSYFKNLAEDTRDEKNFFKLIAGAKEFTEQLDLNNLIIEYYNDVNILLSNIVAQDPETIYTEEDLCPKVILSKNANDLARALLEHYKQTVKEIKIIDREIENNKRKLFKHYKEELAKIEVSEYEDIYTK